MIDELRAAGVPVTVSVTDAGGLTTTRVVTIVVDPVNRAPVAEDIDIEADTRDLSDGAYRTIRAMQRAMLDMIQSGRLRQEGLNLVLDHPNCG